MNNKTIKPGAFQTGRTKGGLNLNKFVKDLLVSIGFATVDETLCCTFYPTVPTISAASAAAPTEDEMDAAEVPSYGMFKTVNGTVVYVYMRGAGGDGYAELGSNA